MLEAGELLWEEAPEGKKKIKSNLKYLKERQTYDFKGKRIYGLLKLSTGINFQSCVLPRYEGSGVER